jgi:hypothetical protein
LRSSKACQNQQVEQGVELRPPDQRRDRALVGDRKGHRVGFQIGGHRGAVPQHEADVDAEAFTHVREQGRQALEPSCRGGHARKAFFVLAKFDNSPHSSIGFPA